MSTGGIYKGPGGQDLYGDGREVTPIRTLPSRHLPVKREVAFIVTVQFLRPRRFFGRKLCIKRWLVLEITEQRALLALDLDRSILPGLRAGGCEITSTFAEPVSFNNDGRCIIEL